MLRLLAFAGAVALTSAAGMPHIKSSNGNFNVYADKFVVARTKSYKVDSRDLEDANDNLAAELAEFDKIAAELLSTAGEVKSSTADATSADSAGAVTAVDGASKSIDTKAQEWQAQHEKDQEALAGVITNLADAQWDKDVDALLSNLKDDLMGDIKSGKSDALKKTAAANAAEGTTKRVQDELAASLSAYETCTRMGKLFVKGQCEYASPSNAGTTKVYQRTFNNADGRDSGYVSNRYIQFKKLQDDTFIRVFYYDNFRVHGHTAHANWNVMVCDANGNGCSECREPAKLNMNKYSSHYANWWMQDYVGGTITGMCRASNNRRLNKGTYQLKVMINNNRYDIYTGHNQGNWFMVDEVVKQN